MSFVSLVLAAAMGGFFAGFMLACLMASATTVDLWEVTTLDGEKRWFTDPEAVTEYMRDRGLVAVRRLRALS